MPGLREFFLDLDALWPSPDVAAIPVPIPLRVMGSTALMLLTGYDRGTKDSDVFETQTLTGPIQDRLRSIAGKASELRTRHRMYLDVVRNGVPFLPHRPLWHPVPHERIQLQNFTLDALDVTDVVVSKLKPLRGSDLVDIEAMFALGHLDHQTLVSRFREAVDLFAYDARADDLPKIVANLHRVERDIFETDESEIELPSWI